MALDITKGHSYKKQFQIDDEVTIFGDTAAEAIHGKITKIYGNYTHYDVDLLQRNEIKCKVKADKIAMTVYEQYAAYIDKNDGQLPPRPGSLIAFAEQNGVNVKYDDAKTIIGAKPDTTCIYKSSDKPIDKHTQAIIKLINDVVSANKFKYPLLSRTEFQGMLITSSTSI